MKKNLILIFAILFIINVNTYAQNNINHHAISLELGGKGLLYSINYEYQFEEKFIISGGLSFLNVKESEIDKSSVVMSFPVSFSYLVEMHKEHFAEFGLGLTNLMITGDLVEYGGNSDFFLNPNILIGYRYQPENSKWHYKAMFSPFLGTRSLTGTEGTAFIPFGSLFQIWGGLAIGYRL